MNALVAPSETLRRYFEQLPVAADASPNTIWLARMLASWRAGFGALPDHLGLPPEIFREMLAAQFPGFSSDGVAPSGRKADFSRMLEREDLVRLLNGFCVLDGPERHWLVGVLVAGCLGDDHLWQDMGLWSRADLSGLMEANFPELAARNINDMKWKKFLYKQLCEAEGIYICRAPSCQVCVDYARCYGPEE